MSAFRLFATLPLLALLALLVEFPPEASARDLFSRVSPSAPRAGALAVRPATALLVVDRGSLEALRASPSGVLKLPLPDGSAVDLILERFELFTPDARVTWTDGEGAHPLDLDVTLFRGRVADDPAGWAIVALSPRGVRATLQRHGERLVLMPAAPAGAPGAELALHALAAEESLEPARATFRCGVDGANEALLERPDPPGGGAQPGRTELDATRRVLTVAVDCDEEIANAKFGGSVSAAADYVTTLLGTVSLIYERDLEVTLNLSYLNFWTAADPYTQATTNGELPEFQNWWNDNRGFVPRSIAHLLSGRPLGGGIAYLNVLCSGSLGYGLSAIDCAYGYPNNSTTWDVEVVAHEIGHNFGAWHTHSCQWAANGYVPAATLLDSCQASEGGCIANSLHVPGNKGTIMSYCHQLSGGISNIRLDFHPVCITRMRQKTDLAACASSPGVAPPRNVTIAAIPTGAHLAWDASSSPDVVRYDVYRSVTQLDLHPVKVGEAAGLSYDDPGLGSFFYKVRTQRAADSSAFGAEVKLTLCSFAVQPNTGVGSAPIAIAPGDFNGDGIADLAVANQGDGTLSVLAGNGTAGIGDGTFGAPTSVPTAFNAQCLLATDTNGDGLYDLVAGNSFDNSLYVHPGGGAAGVPDGTFGAATVLSLGFAPSAIAAADFDEDGIPDLVVAGQAAGLVTLRGGGTGGVPDGTFGAPVPVAAGAATRGVLVADFNEDGIWDLATTTGFQLKVLLGLGSGGHGDGTFAAPTTSNTGANGLDLASGDFNLDGITDLAVCNSTASSVSVFLGNGSGGIGDGTFPAAGLTAVSNSNPRGVAVGDWNGDGVPDLVVANNTATKTASVLTGKGNGSFNAALTWTAALNPWALAIGDWNHDGGIDLAVLNKGVNAFTPIFAGCTNALSLALGVSDPAAADTLIETIEHTLAWTKGAGVPLVDVQVSRDAGVTWATIARHQIGTEFRWSVTGPATTHARLRVVDSARGWVMGASAADFTILPQSVLGVGVGGPATSFRLLGAWPNPARGAFAVTLSLPEGGRGATLQVLDLSGRRMAETALGALGPGVHVVPVGGAGLHPGVYLVRLARGGVASTRKVAILN